MSSEFLRMETPKDPEDRQLYGFDWEPWLDGDTISGSTWRVESGLDSDTPAVDGDVTSIWLSGGTAGNTYWVENKITTFGGARKERTFVLRVVER
jgi:hypothetical protein